MSRDGVGFVDLHIHTDYSDGALSPRKVVDLAHQEGLRAIGIADHDCVDGIEIAVSEGKRRGVEIVSAIEMSVSSMEMDVHLLGYFIDPRDPDLLKYLDFFNETRQHRARRIVECLNELGIDLQVSTVTEIAGKGSVGRPHVAKSLVDEGYCRSIEEAFGRFLRDGGPAFVEKYRMSAERAIDVIRRAGGLAVLAHPGFYDDEGLIAHLFDVGLDGLEVYNPKHRERQVRRFEEIVEDRQGIASGGSDFHGGRENALRFGEFKVPYPVLTRMKEYSRAIRTASCLTDSPKN